MASIRTVLLYALLQGQAPEGPPRPPESPPAHQKFADRFREAINERKPDLLRSTYAPGLLAITKPEHAAEIVAEFLAAQGKIKKMEETGILGDVAYFKLTTERGAMNLKIYMLSDGPIINYFVSLQPISAILLGKGGSWPVRR